MNLYNYKIIKTNFSNPQVSVGQKQIKPESIEKKDPLISYLELMKRLTLKEED